jgi:phosphate starvation-inducible PhoH-like protein
MSRKHKNDTNGNGQLPATNSNKLHKEFKTKSDGQHDYVRAIVESDIVFCTGPAGTGKTACAVGLACEYLVKGKIENIVISRPVMETGRTGLGYLPGTFMEKIHPYLVPILDEMNLYLGKARTDLFLKNETIRIVPLEYMRGYNLHNSFIILDEAQNATLSQIKMILTRIGRESKLVINGDLDQSDLYDADMGLHVCLDKLNDVRGVSIIQLSDVDIIRNSIISRILEKLK